MMRVVEAKIIIGKRVGNVAFIPRIKFIFDNNDLPFTFFQGSNFLCGWLMP
jgi:hypothetical protein